MPNLTDRTDRPEDAEAMDELKQGVAKAKERLQRGRMEPEPEPEPKPKAKPKKTRRTVTK